MRTLPYSLFRSMGSRSFSSPATSAKEDKIVAAVLFERLPVVIPKIDPVVYAFHEFSLRWGQQYRRKYPDEVLGKGDERATGGYKMDYVPAPRITEADKTNDRKSLKRALDRRLYLLLYGSTYGDQSNKPVWHFPEKVYENEDTLRLCAESALKSVLGGLDHAYFVGNAPFAHMKVEPSQASPDSPDFTRFFFKSQIVGATKVNVGKCEDHVWVTKNELMTEYLPEHADLLNKMIIQIF